MHIDFRNKYSKYLALLNEKDFEYLFLNEIEKLKEKIESMKNVIKSQIGKIGHDGSWGKITKIALQLQHGVTVDGIIAN